MNRSVFAATTIAAAAVASAAGATPAPVLTGVSPQPIVLQNGGELVLTVHGSELLPTPGEIHPDIDQYWHFFFRSVSASGQAGDWRPCNRPGGCVFASYTDSDLTFDLNPNSFGLAPGGHLQMHYWKGLADPNATDPSQGVYAYLTSDWSNIVTWDVVDHLPATPTPSSPSPKPNPTLKRLPNLPNAPSVQRQTTTPKVASVGHPQMIPQSEATYVCAAAPLQRSPAGPAITGAGGAPFLLHQGQKVTVLAAPLATAASAWRQVRVGAVQGWAMSACLR